MKQRILPLFPLLILAVSACGRGGGGGSVDPSTLESKLNSGKTLADLGHAEIHQGYVDLVQQVNPNLEAQIKSPPGKKRLVDSLIEQELFYQESMKRGIYKLPNVQERVALYTRVLYGQALLDEEINKKAKEYYDANKDKEFVRVKVAHILIKPKMPPEPTPKLDKSGKPIPQAAPTSPPDNSANEAEALKTAQEVKSKLSNGMAWGDAVTTYSMDLATKTKNGDLGYLTRGDRRIPRLDWNDLVEKAFTMKIGENSDPIKAKDGYHIITLEEEPSVAPYEEVQNTIKFKIRAQVKNDILADLTKGAKTEYKDPELNLPEGAQQMPLMLPPGAGGPPPGAAAPSSQAPSPGLQVITAPPKAAPAPSTGSEKKGPTQQPKAP